MKRVKFDDAVEGRSSDQESKRVKKHTLDSDEEDSSEGEDAKQWVKCKQQKISSSY